MTRNRIPDDTSRPVNPLQFVALNALATLGVVAGLKLAGMSWAGALVAGWVGGSLLTLAGSFLAVTICERRRSLRSANLNPAAQAESFSAPALVPSEISDPMQVWAIDQQIEQGFARKRSAGAGGERQTDRGDVQVMPENGLPAGAEVSELSDAEHCRSQRQRASTKAC
ncbi:hypothetical protein [Roseobacter weihaiensis]|uniref:hypothetical protein n=1 Tax=Roseobacter weihaiensis TaxID=2763262 RepID=UPI001D0B5066|nr:hypothetical protein [Roseobacter sp. H9]